MDNQERWNVFLKAHRDESNLALDIIKAKEILEKLANGMKKFIKHFQIQFRLKYNCLCKPKVKRGYVNKRKKQKFTKKEYKTWIRTQLSRKLLNGLYKKKNVKSFIEKNKL